MNEQFTVRVGFLKRPEDLLNGAFFTPKNQYVQMDPLPEAQEQTGTEDSTSSHTAIAEGLTPAPKTASAGKATVASSQTSDSFVNDIGQAALNAFGVFGEPSNPTVTIPSNANDTQVNARDSQVLGGQMSKEAVDAAAKNPAFAQIAAFFLALSKWIADAFAAIQKHVEESGSKYQSHLANVQRSPGLICR